MNYKLKYYLTSLVISSIFSVFLFFILPSSFISSFSGGFFPFGDLLGGVIYLFFLFFILLILAILFPLIAAIKAPKGIKLSAAFWSFLGFLTPIVIIYFVLHLISQISISNFKQSEKLTTSLIQEAIAENNPKYCEDLFDHWKTQKYDDRNHQSQNTKDNCYFWLAYKTNNYSYCAEIGKNLELDKYSADPTMECWTFAAIKNHNLSYCYNISTKSLNAENSIAISNCITSIGKLTNNSSKIYNPDSTFCADPTWLCDKCKTMNTKPIYCDYDYNFYVER